jgi:hypothetical protein
VELERRVAVAVSYDVVEHVCEQRLVSGEIAY